MLGTARRWVVGAALAALVGCAGTGTPADETAVVDPTPSLDVERGAKLVRSGRTQVDSPHRARGYVVENLNLELEVADPAAAVERARRQIEDLGGFVDNASVNGGIGSINATLPPGSLHEARLAFASVGGKTVSESAGRHDQSASFNDTRRRLDRVELARAEVLDAIKRADDPDAADGLGLLLELTENERRNLISQLASMREQADKVHVYVTVRPEAPEGAAPSPELGFGRVGK